MIIILPIFFYGFVQLISALLSIQQLFIPPIRCGALTDIHVGKFKLGGYVPKQLLDYETRHIRCLRNNLGRLDTFHVWRNIGARKFSLFAATREAAAGSGN